MLSLLQGVGLEHRLDRSSLAVPKLGGDRHLRALQSAYLSASSDRERTQDAAAGSDGVESILMISGDPDLRNEIELVCDPEVSVQCATSSDTLRAPPQQACR